MLNGLDEFAHYHFDAEFFTQLTRETRFKTFIALALATGKFPQSAEMCVSVALRDEQLAIAKDEAGADFNDLLRVQS